MSLRTSSARDGESGDDAMLCYHDVIDCVDRCSIGGHWHRQCFNSFKYRGFVLVFFGRLSPKALFCSFSWRYLLGPRNNLGSSSCRQHSFSVGKGSTFGRILEGKRARGSDRVRYF